MPCVTACAPLCALIARGSESSHLPAIWGAVEGSAGGERKSRKNKLPHLPAVRRGTCGRHQQQVEEGDFTHPRVGQAERLACRERQPNAFLRAEARTHFFRPAGPIDTFLITLPV